MTAFFRQCLLRKRKQIAENVGVGIGIAIAVAVGLASMKKPIAIATPLPIPMIGAFREHDLFMPHRLRPGAREAADMPKLY
jgi:hypothetical protein